MWRSHEQRIGISLQLLLQRVATCCHVLLVRCYVSHDGGSAVQWVAACSGVLLVCFYVQQYAFKHVPCLTDLCDMTQSYVWHDAYVCVTGRMCYWCYDVCHVTPWYMLCDLFMCVTWHIHKCKVTHSYVWRRLNHMRGMVQALCHLCRHYAICAATAVACSDVFVTWLIHACDTHMYDATHSCVVTRRIHMCDMCVI